MLFFIVSIKIIFFCVSAIIIRGTLPRYRFDQLSYLTWKNFIFLWLSTLVLNCSILFFFL